MVQQFYPGELGGLAIAEIIFGAVNPSGMYDDVVQRVLPSLSSTVRRQTSRVVPKKHCHCACLLQLPQRLATNRPRSGLPEWLTVVWTPGTCSSILITSPSVTRVILVRPRHPYPYVELRSWAELHDVQLVCLAVSPLWLAGRVLTSAQHRFAVVALDDRNERGFQRDCDSPQHRFNGR